MDVAAKIYEKTTTLIFISHNGLKGEHFSKINGENASENLTKSFIDFTGLENIQI